MYLYVLLLDFSKYFTIKYRVHECWVGSKLEGCFYCCCRLFFFELKYEPRHHVLEITKTKTTRIKDVEMPTHGQRGV